MKNPKEHIPKATFYSLAATIVISLLVVFVAIGTLGAEALGGAGETAIAQGAEGFVPRFPVLGTGASIIAFGAVFSTGSALNAVVLASSRVAFAMGREGQLPAVGRIHHRFGTTLRAVVASAGDAGVGNLDAARHHATVVVDRETPLQQEPDDPLLTRTVIELLHNLLEQVTASAAADISL